MQLRNKQNKDMVDNQSIYKSWFTCDVGRFNCHLKLRRDESTQGIVGGGDGERGGSEREGRRRWNGEDDEICVS